MGAISGAFSGIREPRWAIVRSQDELATLWDEHAQGNDWPELPIDFSTHTVVAYFAGMRPSGGYQVEIELTLDGRAAQATVTAPADSDFVTHVMTAPFCMLIAPLLDTDPVCSVAQRRRSA